MIVGLNRKKEDSSLVSRQQLSQWKATVSAQPSSSLLCKGFSFCGCGGICTWLLTPNYNSFLTLSKPIFAGEITCGPFVLGQQSIFSTPFPTCNYHLFIFDLSIISLKNNSEKSLRLITIFCWAFLRYHKLCVNQEKPYLNLRGFCFPLFWLLCFEVQAPVKDSNWKSGQSLNTQHSSSQL